MQELLKEVAQKIDKLCEDRTPVDTVVYISQSQPWFLDTKGRSHVYVYCDSAQTLQVGNIANVSLTAHSWVELPFPVGTPIYAEGQPSLIPIFVRCTDALMVWAGASPSAPTSNINLAQVGGSSVSEGQKTSAASIPVVIASDQSAIPITGSITASNPSVGPTGSPVPADGTLIAGNNGGTLQAITVDASGRPTVNVNGTANVNLDHVGGSALALGQTTMAGSLPVTLASNQSNVPVAVQNFPTDQAVNLDHVGGSALALGQTTMAGSLPVTLASNQSNVPVAVQNFPTDQAVNLDHVGGSALALGQTTMAGSLPVTLASNQSNVPVNIAQVLGAALAANNAIPVNLAQISFLLSGQVFTTSSGLTTNSAGGNFPLSIFNPAASGKNVLILSVYVTGVTTGFTAFAFPTTADPAYGTIPTILNRKPGGSASVVSASMTTTSQTLPSSTPIAVIASGANNPYELFVNLVAYLLPVGSANGITIWNSPTGASKWASTVTWIEF